jgi:hypothetical protein
VNLPKLISFYPTCIGGGILLTGHHNVDENLRRFVSMENHVRTAKHAIERPTWIHLLRHVNTCSPFGFVDRQSKRESGAKHVRKYFDGGSPPLPLISFSCFLRTDKKSASRFRSGTVEARESRLPRTKQFSKRILTGASRRTTSI